MKRKTLIFNAVLIFIGIFTILIAGVNNFKTNRLLIRGEPESYSITLNNTTNKLTADSGFVSGTSSVKTGLNNSISFDYTNLKDDINIWQIIEVGGSFENTIPISGLTSMLITKDADTHIGVYWSPIQLFDEEHYIEFDTSSGLEVSTSFNDELPNYFKVVALGSSDASITSISIEYSCAYDLPDTLEIGMYPQTKVVDDSLIETLEGEIGDLPTSSDSKNWTSYNYYISSSNETDFMWYIDIEEGNELYRGVYFTSYRPERTSHESSTTYSYQDNNGYFINTTYWFKYESIVWDVLLVNEVEGPLLLSNMIIDSQDYYHSAGDRNIDGKAIYANNYKESYVRDLLNDNLFINNLDNKEKSLITTTTVDNSVYSTGYGSNQYICEDTSDKLFLLSYREAVNTNYGFINNNSRKRQASDYAKAMGIYVKDGNSSWWFRSPNNGSKSNACYGQYDGATVANILYNTTIGVLPALRLNR